MDKRIRPSRTEGGTEMYNTGCGHIYITVNNRVDEKEIFEVFATLGKSGNCAHCQLEALTKSITIGLRYGISVTEYISRLKEIKCQLPAWDQGVSIQSCPDAIARALEKVRVKLSGRQSGCEGEEITPKCSIAREDD